MAVWKITVSGKGIRQASVERVLRELKEKFGDEAVSTAVEDASPPESRADRFSEAVNKVGDARGEAEALRDELQEWRDGMPENLQSGSKAEELDEAIGQLEEFIGHCEEAEGAEVSFPGMR